MIQLPCSTLLSLSLQTFFSNKKVANPIEVYRLNLCAVGSRHWWRIKIGIVLEVGSGVTFLQNTFEEVDLSTGNMF